MIASVATKATGIGTPVRLHQQAKAVGAKAEEHAVAERNQAGIADQQVERGREQAEAEQRMTKSSSALLPVNSGRIASTAKATARSGRRDSAQRRTAARRRQRLGASGLELGHATSLPNRPVGLRRPARSP